MVKKREDKIISIFTKKIQLLKKHNDLNKSLEGYGAGEKISKEDFFKIKTDIVIPAALELQIGKEEAENMNCQLVVEAANGPVDIEGDEILLDKGIDIITRIGVNNKNHNGGCSLLKGFKNLIDSPQNVLELSFPINKSLNKKPAKIAPIESKIKGKIIVNGDS